MGTPTSESTKCVTLVNLSLARAQISADLAALGVDAPAGNFYALEVSRHLGLGDIGGVRVGLAPYTSRDDVDRLIAGLHRITT